MDYKCKEPEEIGFAKLVSIPNGTVLKVIAQNSDEAAFSYYWNLMRFQTNVPWSHIDVSPPGPI